jgi:hypothetical protein
MQLYKNHNATIRRDNFLMCYLQNQQSLYLSIVCLVSVSFCINNLLGFRLPCISGKANTISVERPSPIFSLCAILGFFSENILLVHVMKVMTFEIGSSHKG